MSPNFPSLNIQSAARLGLPVTGRCVICGRQAPGVPVPDMGKLCEGDCPRCGARPFYLDHIAPYTGDVSRMSLSEAITYVEGLDDPNELETCFRLEIMGQPPRGRRELLEAGYARYWQLAWLEDPLERARILTVDECIDVWTRELEDPRIRRLYAGLILSGLVPDPAPAGEVAI